MGATEVFSTAIPFAQRDPVFCRWIHIHIAMRCHKTEYDNHVGRTRGKGLCPLSGRRDPQNCSDDICVGQNY